MSDVDPRLAGPKAEDPVTHRRDVDAVAAVRVDGELWLGGRARRGEDERGVLAVRVRGTVILAVSPGDELRPRQLPAAGRARSGGPSEDDHVLDVARPGVDRVVDDPQQVNVLALAVRDIRCEHEA